MEPEENIVNLPQPEQRARGCYKANLILNAFIALGLGIAIILILNVFNRSGWFALLSGLFGTMFYCAIVFPKILFGPIPERGRRNYGNRNNVQMGGEQGDRRTAKSMALSGLVVASTLAIAASIGLYYLPANRPIFALVDAVLAIVICIALFMIGLCILIFFFGRGRREGNGGHIDL
ncbi:MAG: hypothetical protein JO215_13925 [Ktedonobacteraceae bacterium]|nr:hypothetical protein [Ktedonobacteraceae bacterium]